jgi:hypothetical protein
LLNGYGSVELCACDDGRGPRSDEGNAGEREARRGCCRSLRRVAVAVTRSAGRPHVSQARSPHGSCSSLRAR